MRVHVKLVRPFRDAVGQPMVELEVRDASLVRALDALVQRYPGLREHLFEGDALSPYVNIYLNAEPVHVEEVAKVALRDGDELMFLLPLTGGGARGRCTGLAGRHRGVR